MAGRVATSSAAAAPLASPLDEKPTTHPKRRWLTILKWLISLLLIGWILWRTDLREIGAALLAASPWLLLLAASLHLIGLLISAYRWRLLLRATGADAALPFLMESYMVSIFFNNFLPSTIGGDAIRAYDSWRVGVSKSQAVAIIFVDRFLGLVALMCFALVALPFSDSLTQTVPWLKLWVLLGFAAMLTVVWAIFFLPSRLADLIGKLPLPFSAKIQRLLAAFLTFQGRRDVLLKQLGLSLLLQINVIIHYYLIAQALHLAVPLFSFFLMIPLITVIMMLPISINAIGIRESAFSFFLAANGVAAADAVALAWIAYGLVLLQGVIGGIFYALRK